MIRMALMPCREGGKNQLNLGRDKSDVAAGSRAGLARNEDGRGRVSRSLTVGQRNPPAVFSEGRGPKAPKVGQGPIWAGPQAGQFGLFGAFPK
jgi:hypothetical protein